jgi:hypothetical protein
MGEEVQDTTQQSVDGDGGSDANATDQDTDKDVSTSEQDVDGDGAGEETDTDGDGVGADSQPKGVTNKDQEFLTNLLLEHDLESPEQLGDFIKSLTGLKGKIGDFDVDDLIENKALMTKYQKHWAAQEAQKKKEGETSEETIARLEREISERDKKDFQTQNQEKELKEARKALDTFNNTVSKTIKGITNVPEEYRDFLGLFMGVNNPINEVDLKDRGRIIELTKKGAKQLLDFEQVIIKRYIEGKAEVPKVTPATDTATDTGEKPVKNIADARKRMTQVVLATLGKKKK